MRIFVIDRATTGIDLSNTKENDFVNLDGVYKSTIKLINHHNNVVIGSGDGYAGDKIIEDSINNSGNIILDPDTIFEEVVFSGLDILIERDLEESLINCTFKKCTFFVHSPSKTIIQWLESIKKSNKIHYYAYN